MSMLGMLHYNCIYCFCLLRFGDISLQERINQKNFELLEAYYKSLSGKVSVECKCIGLRLFFLNFEMPSRSYFLVIKFWFQKWISESQKASYFDSNFKYKVFSFFWPKRREGHLVEGLDLDFLF